MKSVGPDTAPWHSGLRAARANAGPGFAVQAAALVLVLGYYFNDRIHGALAALSVLRQSIGLPFAIVSTALFGGLIPFLYLRWSARASAGQPHYSALQGLGLILLWAYKGFEVDLWYRCQAWTFGSGHDFWTIVKKVVFDEFGYCPIWAVPVMTALYQWIDCRFDWQTVVSDIRSPRWYRRRVLPVLIANMGVWIPAVAIIYALPTPLQLPLQNIVLCFYTLIVAHQTRANPAVAAAQSTQPEVVL
jgi:hypothetical protein